MKIYSIKNLIYFFVATFLFYACGSRENASSKSLEAKKKQLENLKKTTALLEAEIKSLDTNSAAISVNGKLLTAKIIVPSLFEHYIDLQGKIVNESNVMVLPLGNPGQIKQIFMKEGDRVKKDEIILKLDDTIIKTQIAALTTQLDFARDLYQRQNKLWQQKIGSEVQVLNAKNTVVNLENQLQILNRSLDFTNVKAPIDGTIDILNVKKGEVFNGFTGRGEAQIRVTNSKDMKLSVLVPENYSTKVKINYPVKVEFPDNNRSFYQKIKSIAQYIDPSTRSFAIEIPIPQGNDLRPNQIGIVKILDFSMPKAIVIPVNIIQTDENGKYVYIAKTESDKKLAQKVYIELGEVYGEKAQIKKGLSLKDVLIIEGYQNISDGQELTNIQVD